MSAAKKGLGRGFESLIPTDLIDDTFNPMVQEERRVSDERSLPLSKIHANPDQPRRTFEKTALAELTASIKEHGVLQPILVVPHGDGYQIVAGERRFRASKDAGLSEIPVVIRTMTDQHQLEVSLIENIQRHDLNAIETAVAYAKLRDQFNLTNEQIANRVHKSLSAVVNTMRLLKLPKEVIALIAEGTLREGQARPLIGQDPALLEELVPRIVAESWSSRKIEQYIARLKQGVVEEVVSTDAVVDTEVLEKSLSSRFDAKVAVKVGKGGSGKISISFASPEELERIQNLLK